MFFHHRKICMSFHFSVQINLELLFSILFAFMEMNLCSKCIISIMTTKVSQREAYFFEALGLGETIFNKIIKLWQYCAFLDFFAQWCVRKVLLHSVHGILGQLPVCFGGKSKSDNTNFAANRFFLFELNTVDVYCVQSVAGLKQDEGGGR